MCIQYINQKIQNCSDSQETHSKEKEKKKNNTSFLALGSWQYRKHPVQATKAKIFGFFGLEKPLQVINRKMCVAIISQRTTQIEFKGTLYFFGLTPHGQLNFKGG